MQVGFGLWGKYHIYDGIRIIGRTFPSKDFQETFLKHLNTVFKDTPWLPLDEYQGRSKAGKYGDFVSMTDDMVGKILDV